MPKSYGKLYEQVISMENLLDSYKEAAKFKRLKKEIVVFHNNFEDKIVELQRKLMDKTWEPLPTKQFVSYNEVKLRTIDAPKFRDRIVHHAIVRVLTPIFEKKFIYDSYSCRIGKGTHRAVKRTQDFIRQNSDDAYVVKMDISKFFNSIDHDILIKILSKTIREQELISLIKKAISYKKDRKGITIGSYVSQLLSNIYLNELDKYCKIKLQAKHYIRYADDFFIVCKDKETAHKFLNLISTFLEQNLKLRLNPKSSVFKIKQGIDFAGYKTFRNCIKARKRNLLSAKLRFKKLSKLYSLKLLTLAEIKPILASFFGYIEHCNAYYSSKFVLRHLLLKSH